MAAVASFFDEIVKKGSKKVGNAVNSNTWATAAEKISKVATLGNKEVSSGVRRTVEAGAEKAGVESKRAVRQKALEASKNRAKNLGSDATTKAKDKAAQSIQKHTKGLEELGDRAAKLNYESKGGAILDGMGERYFKAGEDGVRSVQKMNVAKDAGKYALAGTALSDVHGLATGQRDMKTKNGKKNIPLVPFF